MRIPAGVAVFLLIVLLFEMLLGLAGLEEHDRKFAPRSSYPVFTAGEGAGADLLVTSSHFRGFLNYQEFAARKAEGVRRVFVVGGSAAYAWPYGEEYGFTGYLRRALEKVSPGGFEIINAAGMSYGSHRVLDVLGDVVLHDPDLVVVYSGNNEYVERNVLPAAGPGGGRGGVAEKAAGFESIHVL